MRLVAAFLVLATAACSVTVEDGDESGEDILLSDPDLPDRTLFAAGATVGDVARTACSTAGVRPLAEQLLAEVNCLRPGTLTSIAGMPGVSLGAGALPQLNVAAANALRAATAGNAISISSSTRATAQQYVLHYWYTHNRCTNVVSLAAKPGSSNHESGVAIDVPSYSSWRTRLEARGWKWLGSSDPVHFDYKGAGAVDLRPLAVKSFQRLWNRNHPTDRIAEDGVWGAATASRMDRAPAGGFAIGPSCDSTPMPTTATLAGFVYDSGDTTRRVAGATVAVGARTATTVADGSYRLDGLTPGAATVTVTASGFRTTSVQLNLATATANTSNVNLTRATGATAVLKGVIYRGTDSTDRIAGATVTLSTGQTATAGSSGLYTFAAVPVGPVTITAAKAGFATRSITRTVEANVENWGSLGLTAGSALVDECGDIDAVGTCEGDVVHHCDAGRLVSVDCSASGRTCGWNDGEEYFDCR